MWVEINSTGKLLVAYSGGVDSHVLLHCLSQSNYKNRLTAIHVDHQLHSNSKQWTQHCARVCAALSVPLRVEIVSVEKNKGDSLEEQARRARYAAILKHVDVETVVLTAQHADDQAETVLMQLFRGAGVSGLAAMPQVKVFGRGRLERPLLNKTRADIVAYANEHNLQWLEDPSNQNKTLTRNFIRHEVMPLLRSRWPSVVKTIARSAHHCGEASELLDEYASQVAGINFITQELSARGNSFESRGIIKDCFAALAVTTVSPAAQKNLIRYWLKQTLNYIPNENKLRAMMDMPNLPTDAHSAVALDQHDIRYFQSHFYIVPKIKINDYAFTWDLKNDLVIPGVGTLCLVKDPNGQVDLKKCQYKNMIVRNRRGGESILLPSQKHHKKLKQLFLEWSVPPWQRPYWPLLVVESEVIAVPGLAVSEKVCSDQGGFSLQII
ncbi:MAG: tRNA lysidine(34) synthetase TilS [Verrucomicrobia bacterium RIFCSPHIGHO2_12_FULL_41_10]|nr:MAG: tRNA lysidine(34) synthetase TilS [Verrucomicrobia bacterium RIFCSPHIGHO2_12_FULL_41_10]